MTDLYTERPSATDSDVTHPSLDSLCFGPVFRELYRVAAATSGCYESFYAYSVAMNIAEHLKTLTGSRAELFREEAARLGHKFDSETLLALRKESDDELWDCI